MSDASTPAKVPSVEESRAELQRTLDAIEDKNTWFVRTSGYVSGPDDVYVANSYIRRFNLRRGDRGDLCRALAGVFDGLCGKQRLSERQARILGQSGLGL